jgi:hypothetical protein
VISTSNSNWWLLFAFTLNLIFICENVFWWVHITGLAYIKFDFHNFFRQDHYHNYQYTVQIRLIDWCLMPTLTRYARSRHFVFWFTTSEMWTTILKAFFKKFLLNFCWLCQFAWKSDWFLLSVTNKKPA